MRALFVALAMMLASCVSDGVSSSNTNNSDVSVTLLFQHDGCRIYRFKDGGYYHYYVRCPQSETVTGIGNMLHAGKVAYEDVVPTVENN